MLHITSFMQNIAKLNSRNKANGVSSNPQSVLNGLSRNYSFIYDHNRKRYDYHHFEHEEDDYGSVREGYWGHIRDRNADCKKQQLDLATLSAYDGYWGFFRDCEDDGFDVANGKTLLERPGSSENVGAVPSSPVCSLEGSPSLLSLSSSINSLSRFLEEDEALRKPASLFNRYEKRLEYDYNYKTSKVKIQACKRDEMKILVQSLEDLESKFKKETIKSFDFNCLNIQGTLETLAPSNNLTYSTKAKQINFLHFSNKSLSELQQKQPPVDSSEANRNLTNFKNVFSTLTKLKKSINIFNGDFLNMNRADLFLSFVNNVHASMNDVDGFIFNYMYEKNQLQDLTDFQRQTTNVSLCSNIYEAVTPADDSNDNWLDLNEKTQKLFGHGNHSTMVFEYQNVKIGFMALIDEHIFNKLNDTICEKLKKNSLESKDNSNELSSEINTIEYVDYVAECDKLSKQLRLCGANIIVVLTNMTDTSEQKLVREGADLDIVFSGCQSDLASATDLKKIQVGNRWIIKSGNSFDCISLMSLNLDELNSNKILDVAITRYLIE